MASPGSMAGITESSTVTCWAAAVMEPANAKQARYSNSSTTTPQSSLKNRADTAPASHNQKRYHQPPRCKAWERTSPIMRAITTTIHGSKYHVRIQKQVRSYQGSQKRERPLLR